MEGKIVKIISNLYTVSTNDGTYECRARGKFRNEDITPLVGDYVTIDPDNNYILEIKERKNSLSRPMIANIDACIIVSSLKRPDFSPFLLDKMITNITLKDIEPIVVLSKYDLLEDKEKDNTNKIIEYYNNIGIKMILNTEVNKLINFISGKIVSLTGQTGVGKSTLLNRLDPSLNLATNDISDALGRGKHTTRHVELFKYKDAFIADTPGFSALDLDSDDLENIKFTFPEFDNDECKFRDCKHLKEIGCKVKQDVIDGIILESRYDSYRRMMLNEDNSFISKK